MNRVVITGFGTLNPIGNTIESYWTNLLNGVSGIRHIDIFDVSDYSTQIAGLVRDFDVTTVLDKKEARRTSKFIIFAIAAAQQAIKNSGLDVAANAERIGVEIGSGIGGIEVLENAALTLDSRGPSKISPFTVPMMIADMASGLVAIKTGAKGPNTCTVTACASSANGMGNAYTMVRDGHADAMITGGAEAAVTPLGLASFCAARSLSANNDDPQGASRPFDAGRDGFVMGEGAGVLIFESLAQAEKRGAKIYAEVVGYGASGDAHHLTAPAPEGEGAARAMKMALDMAKLQPTDVDYINAHGTSTLLNDKNETAAIKSVFGDHARALKISSTKSMTGHLLGAAGAIEAICCALSIDTHKIPPTINQKTPDPDCDLDYVPNKAIEMDVNVTMSNSFGFGGHNAVLIFKSL